MDSMRAYKSKINHIQNETNKENFGLFKWAVFHIFFLNEGALRS